MLSNIYVFTNKINGKRYIGQSISPKERYKQHFKDAKCDNLLFHNALLKYGEDNFVFEIIEKDIPLDIIDEREKYWIKFYNSKKPNGYNLTDGGEGTFGYHHTEESKRKMSLAKEGFVPIMTEEVKQKISKALKGRKPSKEVIEKVKIANTGRIHTEESKKKMSDSRKGVAKTEEHVEKVRQSLLNRNEEEKRKSYEKAVATKSLNGVDYAKHFKEMPSDEKDKMYDKISNSNPRRKEVKGINILTGEVIQFTSIGKAGKYMHENFGVSKNAKQTIREALERGTNAYGYKWEYV